ncbi:MAG: amidase [Bdellovibrionales bacterium]|nr:amidase [Bdellovibrionales bacterium]
MFTPDWNKLIAQKNDRRFVLDFYEQLFQEVKRQADLHVFPLKGFNREKVIAQIDAADPSLPLFPLPFGVKDIMNVVDYPTGCGSRLPVECFSGPEASLVTHLKSLGSIVMGKTVTTEFAGRHPGATRNPHNPKHTPGGSSSGSAAGVAAGLFAFALGTQTSGSIIRPASYCGVVGYKPSFDSFPIDGVFPLSPHMDHVGLIAIDVAMLNRIVSTLRKAEGAPRSNERITVGIPKGAYFNKAESVAQEVVYNFMTAASDSEFYRIDVDCLADIDDINERHYQIVREDAVIVHQSLYDQYESLYSDAFGAVVAQGRQLDEATLTHLLKSPDELCNRLHSLMDQYGLDYFLCPSTPSVAPEGLELTGSAIMNLVWTHAGMPAVTIPVLRAGCLPLGLQIVGRRGADSQLLADLSRFSEVVAGANSVEKLTQE